MGIVLHINLTTSKEGNVHIIEMLEMHASKAAGKDFLRISGKGYSYGEVERLVEKSAGLLQSLGIHHGDKVAIMSHNTLGFVLAFLGTLKAGATTVPINHKLMAPEVDYILEHSEAKIFLFDGALAEVAAKLTAPVNKISLDSRVDNYDQFETMLESAQACAPVELSSDDIAEILYTSGTTGKPKGCLHSHRTVMMAAIAMGYSLKYDEDDRILIAMPIWHSAPLNNMFIGGLYVGATIVMIREYHPLHFLQTVQDEKCTVFFGAPIAYLAPIQMLPNFDTFDLSSMRMWATGGGPCSADNAMTIMKKYNARDNFVQAYGLSESGPNGTELFTKEAVQKAGSIGRRGVNGCDFKVMKSETEEAVRGEIGEIWLKNDSNMVGYYKDPEATKAAFYDGWLRTTDVARIDEDGFLFIVDRLKDMIVTGGENVYSKEVEDIIGAHPDIAAAAVIGVPHPSWGDTVCAVIVPQKGKDVTPESVTAFCNDKLAKYKIPRIYKIVDSLPYTPSGKLMKYKLREMFA